MARDRQPEHFATGGRRVLEPLLAQGLELGEVGTPVSSSPDLEQCVRHGHFAAEQGAAAFLVAVPGPSPRDIHAMTCDERRGKLVVFGGRDALHAALGEAYAAYARDERSFVCQSAYH